MSKFKLKVKKKPTEAIKKLEEIANEMNQSSNVKVGIPKNSNDYPDGTSVLMVGVTHEFGATIKHPGGTSYGYQTKEDAEEGKVRFLKSGKGYMELGKTKPHTIVVPERSFLRSTLNENSRKYKAFLREIGLKIALGELTSEKALKLIGLRASSDVKEKITDIQEPSLKHRDGNPLVDTGHLRQSITYEVSNDD